MSDSILKIKDLYVKFLTVYGPIYAVNNLNLSIKSEQILGLVGESGSGKSTVAWTIMGYLGENARPSGEVLFRGRNLLSLNPDEYGKYRGKEISMVYQDPMSSLNPSMTVGRQIQEVLEINQRGSKKETWEASIDMLEKVNIVDPQSSAKKYPHQLSGGQQQRVVIAMALACNPAVLILDEPTTGLDVTTEATILDFVQDLKKKYRSAILFISHNLGVIAKISDFIGVLYAGHLVEEGPVQEIFSNPFHPYTQGLLRCIPKIEHTEEELRPIKGKFPNLLKLPEGCIFHPRCPFMVNRCKNAVPTLAEVMSNRKVACLRYEEIHDNNARKFSSLEAEHQKDRINRQISGEEGKELLIIKSIKKYFGGVSIYERLIGRRGEYIHAVDGLSLEIGTGEVFGLVGESGCGKTTLGRMIPKLYRNTTGSIYYKGKNIWQLDKENNKIFHKEVQIIFQNPDSSLNPRKTVAQILARPLKIYRGVNGNALDGAILDLLDIVKLGAEYRNRFPHELSGGEKQRVGIARAFAGNPELIICDEPLSALDVSVQASILNLIISLQKNFGVALLFISHDLSVVRYISHTVGIMYLGQLVEVGRVEQVFNPPYHPYTEALLSALPTLGHSRFPEAIRLVGPVPSAKRPPSGCRFHTRCPRKIGKVCEKEIPKVSELEPGHLVSCHLYQENTFI